MKNKITKDMKINEIFEKFPENVDELAKVLLDEGFHCFGCPAAGFESLEDGIKSHGKSDKEVEEIIKKLNDVIS